MDWFTLATIILSISALASVFNAKVLKLEDSIGLMATGLVASLLILVYGLIFPTHVKAICDLVQEFNFSEFVLDFALGFLIFAGAFMADGKTINRDRWPILILATIGMILSTFIIGGLSFGLLKLLNLEIPFVHCLLFGALISPTDPIAVLAILKNTAVPKKLQADIAGESLLNDGVAVVVFLTILQIAGGGDHHGHADAEVSVLSVAILFVCEVLGGAVLGLAAGLLGRFLIRLAHNPAVDILVSLAIVMATFSIAVKLHVSGPLALVATGLVLGSYLRSDKLSSVEKDHLIQFWEAIDHILNAVLFTLMGLVLLNLSDRFQIAFLIAGVLAIPTVLLSRLLSLAATVPLTSLRKENLKVTIPLLTWGGLRGEEIKSQIEQWLLTSLVGSFDGY